MDRSPSPTQFFWPDSTRGSLLQELYDHNDVYIDNEWHRPQDYSLVRRATFPYVRRDHDDQIHYHHNHNHNSQLSNYPIYADPSPLHNDSYLNSSPHSSYHDFDHIDESHPIKLEDHQQPVIVPSQSPYFRNPSSPACHPIPMSYLAPHSGLPVQHTDDAASKETQYLRRRCFNCHTTEPPSWRRSTLNPGKIVCNKCGLYERTHLRPRPLRFDELRAGNKARKQSKTTLSPKAAKVSIKREPREFGLVRRASVSSSSASSVRSGSGTSDWDDSVSVYSSSGSGPPTSFNSPNMAPFPLSRDSSSQSPPLSHPPPEGGIRLPNAPLSDIASLQQQQLPTSPRKSATTLPPFFPSSPEYFRRSSLSIAEPPLRDLTGAGGWTSNDDNVLAAAVAAEERNNSVMVARPTAVVS